MSFGNTSENDVLAYLFNATALPSAWTGPFYVDLHTADPGEAGTATTSEATYTGYARVSIARTSGGLTVSGNTVSNTAAVNFAACTAGSNTITHFSIVSTASGAGQILISGALTASLVVSAGITPSFAIGQMSATLD